MRWDLELKIAATPEKVFDIELNWHRFPQLRHIAGTPEFHLLKSTPHEDFFWIKVKDMPIKSSFVYGKRLKRSPDMIVTMFLYRWLRAKRLENVAYLDSALRKGWEDCFYRTIRLRRIGQRATLLQLNEPNASAASEEELAQVRSFYAEIKRIAEGELVSLGIDAVAEAVDAEDAEAWYVPENAEETAEAETIDAEIESETIDSPDDAFDPYHILGIPVDTDMDEVKRTYRILARKWHPDSVVSSGGVMKEYAHNQFITVTAAYHTILRMREE